MYLYNIILYIYITQTQNTIPTLPHTQKFSPSILTHFWSLSLSLSPWILWPPRSQHSVLRLRFVLFLRLLHSRFLIIRTLLIIHSSYFFLLCAFPGVFFFCFFFEVWFCAWIKDTMLIYSYCLIDYSLLVHTATVFLWFYFSFWCFVFPVWYMDNKIFNVLIKIIVIQDII